MKTIKYILLLLCLTIAGNLAFGQNNSLSLPVQNNNTQQAIETFIPTSKTRLSLYSPDKTTLLPADYNAKHVGFFCKEEIKMEQAHIPVKMRLGSLEYCNWLEQKPGYRGMAKQPY